jgi:hypothetical protein
LNKEKIMKSERKQHIKKFGEVEEKIRKEKSMRTKLFRRRAVSVYKCKGWKLDWQCRMGNRTFTIVQPLNEVFSLSKSNK